MIAAASCLASLALWLPGQTGDGPKTPADAPLSKAVAADRKTPADEDATTVSLAGKESYKADQWKHSTVYPWPAVPIGKHRFANIPVDVSGAVFLWGKANADRGMKYADRAPAIPVGRKFEVLYVCHAAFFEAEAGEAMFHVSFRYGGQTVDSPALVSVGDARDWFVRGDPYLPPTNKRSVLAWVGEGNSNGRPQQVRFFMTALDNPRPNEPVTSIDLVSSKKTSAGCIVALTTGVRGLMKPLTKPAPTAQKSE